VWFHITPVGLPYSSERYNVSDIMSRHQPFKFNDSNSHISPSYALMRVQHMLSRPTIPTRCLLATCCTLHTPWGPCHHWYGGRAPKSCSHWSWSLDQFMDAFVQLLLGQYQDSVDSGQSQTGSGRSEKFYCYPSHAMRMRLLGGPSKHPHVADASYQLSGCNRW